ncbi:HyaD/HybD family hydrogenase maturation endopeptidase [Campylobacter sp. faydin G-105]|uniref:HyaD/HybD family hydrogenase maturation endopeptidase n=1 Tax=Campylobacter anatolicus TaxID=2829105 RepID=UPI001B9EB296|nr:HyaD/HybD family hydrogenase maturation endopeptidase [Campylobacter anatolicus]MBR8462906.1 HyaD/HybD family hydrogenase maturation endopeptidase [Campylobacter anatolicus]
MRVLVLGIGNVMFGDEGVGVHFVKMMERDFKFHSDLHKISFIDGGTLAIALTPIIAEYDRLIVVDCINADDGEVGDVYFFDFEQIPPKISWNGSAHEVEMLQTLQLMSLNGDMPLTKILAIVPSRIEPMSFELSSAVQKGVKTMEKALLSHLCEFGFECERVANFSVCDMANEYKTKGLYDFKF